MQTSRTTIAVADREVIHVLTWRLAMLTPSSGGEAKGSMRMIDDIEARELSLGMCPRLALSRLDRHASRGSPRYLSVLISGTRGTPEITGASPRRNKRRRKSSRKRA